MDNVESGVHISWSGTDEAAAQCRHIVTRELRMAYRLA
jgi:hypothetical protein